MYLKRGFIGPTLPCHEAARFTADLYQLVFKAPRLFCRKCCARHKQVTQFISLFRQ